MFIQWNFFLVLADAQHQKKNRTRRMINTRNDPPAPACDPPAKLEHMVFSVDGPHPVISIKLEGYNHDNYIRKPSAYSDLLEALVKQRTVTIFSYQCRAADWGFYKYEIKNDGIGD